MTLNAKALEALRPFAAAADVIGDDLPDDALLFAHFPSMFGGQTEIRVGDLRSARSVLSSQQEEAVPVACDEDSMPERIWAGDFNARGFGHCVIGPQGGLYAEYVRADLAVPPDAGEPGIKAAYERGRADAYDEAADQHEADAQNYNRIRDPGMANHQRSYVRTFRKRAEALRSALVPATSKVKGSE